MRQKRKHHRIRRKDFPAWCSIDNWSRMIHKWWIKDADAERKFKKLNKEEI
jgi:hypothetical protein